MTFTLAFGWWLVPFIITVVSLGWAWWISRDSGPGNYGAGAVIEMMFFLGALVLSLLSWLVWALLR